MERLLDFPAKVLKRFPRKSNCRGDRLKDSRGKVRGNKEDVELQGQDQWEEGHLEEEEST